MDIGYPSNGEIGGETTTIENTTTTEEITEETPISPVEGGATEEVTTEATGTKLYPILMRKLLSGGLLLLGRWFDLLTTRLENFGYNYFLSFIQRFKWWLLCYDASFLKSWEDVKNLKIKFEGVIGGETKFIAYLIACGEVEYQKKEERKNLS